MNETERIQAFDDYVKVCDSKKYGEIQLVGQGNPKADILLVGMEPAIDPGMKSIEEVIQTNVNHFKNEGSFYGIRPRADFKGNHTWKVNQKLIDYIRYGHPKYEPELDFEKDVFTTEMNNWVSKRKAIKSNNRDLFDAKLAQRRRLFKESAFIQDFPVVILACGDYIINYGDTRQIDDTFGVKFIKEEITKSPKGNLFKFWYHESKDGKRIVIHTRQLSSALPNSMLELMAKVIKKHLKKVKNM